VSVGARRRLWTALVAALVMMPSLARAAADECGDSARPWIRVRIGPAEPLGDDVVAQLRAELSARGIDACLEPATARSPETATLLIAAVRDGAPRYTIEVGDALTGKRVDREVDLSRTPPDGRALALAVSADELLRATWAELAVQDAPQPRIVVPPAVKALIDSSIPERATPATLRLGVGAAVERFAGGMMLLGGDVRGETWLGSRAAAVLAAGVRASPEVASTLGQVRTTAVHAGLGARFAVTPDRSPAGLDACLSFDLFGVRFDPDAGKGATATSANDWALAAAGSVGAWAAVTRWMRVRLSAGIGWPIRAVAAAADGDRVTASTGPGFVGSLDVMFLP
jgi:hypothetical protein